MDKEGPKLYLGAKSKNIGGGSGNGSAAFFCPGDFSELIALTQQEKTILSLIEPVADGLGMEIVRVRLMGGRRPTLQVMAEKAGGAPTDVEDCADLSKAISPVLEAADPISDPYRLEVSTPGIDRPLTREGDFGRWAGHLAKIELAMPIEGRRRFQGVIQREDENGVAISRRP